ncbi:Sds3 protein [Martiniozyma asiatica (nom. inval.)]|nr:Sds3 protein [Martiniozyma asiatica]
MAMELSKRERRKMQIEGKLIALHEHFLAEKDTQYREALLDLQYRLSALHQRDSPLQLQPLQDLLEERDFYLYRLRLSEEYHVKLINDLFTTQYNTIVNDANTIVASVKQKLHDGLTSKIRQLKDDKALIDIVTSSSSAHNTRTRAPEPLRGNDGNVSGVDSSTSFFFSGERRSRRKRDDFTMTSNDDSYDSGSTTTGGRKRKREHVEDDRVWTESKALNEFLYGSEEPKRKERASATAGSRRGVLICPALEAEEVNEDLGLLRQFKKSRR